MGWGWCLRFPRFKPANACQRPWRSGYIFPLPNYEANRCRGRSVLGWGTAWEAFWVLLAFLPGTHGARQIALPCFGCTESGNLRFFARWGSSGLQRGFQPLQGSASTGVGGRLGSPLDVAGFLPGMHGAWQTALLCSVRYSGPQPRSRPLSPSSGCSVRDD